MRISPNKVTTPLVATERIDNIICNTLTKVLK